VERLLAGGLTRSRQLLGGLDDARRSVTGLLIAQGNTGAAAQTGIRRWRLTPQRRGSTCYGIRWWYAQRRKGGQVVLVPAPTYSVGAKYPVRNVALKVGNRWPHQGHSKQHRRAA